MPDPVLDTGDTAVNMADETLLCPQGLDILYGGDKSKILSVSEGGGDGEK